MATTNTGTTATETFGTSSPVTGSAPSAVNGTDGQPLKDLTSISLFVSVASGVTLSGAGTLQAYIWDPSGPNRWARAPLLDRTISTSGVRDLFVDTFDVTTARNAYVKWVPSGVTFSSGTAGVIVTQAGFHESLRGKYA